ncbi:hypothetical protein [Providencia rettgeri]|uniref:tail fiber/spike domain-containing protein n=1 Tax=Providencia rettgeri TaxID=587 RepID=UPI0023AA7DF2|nr:hypothetical protein [Providencia rettgeri]
MRQNVKPTQEPVPSSNIKDLFFNSGLLDIWATSLERKYIDRFGNCHLTAAGMEWIFNELVTKFKIESEQALLAAGYAPAGTFQEGAEIVSRNGTVLWKLPDGDGDYYRWDGDLPKQVPAGSTPQSTGGIGKGTWVSVGDASLRGDLQSTDGARFIGGSIWVTEDIDSVIARTPFPSTSIRIISRGNALFKVKSGTSKYPLINPQINTNTYIELQSENGEITTTGAGATDYDDTFILDQAMKYGKEINATVKIDCKMTMRTPLDEHTYIRLPTDFTIYNANPRVNRISLRPQSGSVRDAALCLESFKGLQGTEPDMCSGTVCTDVYITMDGSDGGEIKVGHCLIGGMFRTVFTRPYASGFTLHNILLCRAWYSSYSGLFGRAGKGSGVTIGKHPDINQSWDGAVNGIYIDEVWGHTNGQAGTWVEDTNEDIGYGVGIYGEMFSVHIGKVIGELNKGSGFQNKMKYGSLKVDSMYLEANTGLDYYCAVTNSAGISWQTPDVFLSQRGKVKVKPDSNTSASLIGFPFSIDSSNSFDFTGVSGSRVRLSKESAYAAKTAIAKTLSENFSTMSSVESSLNTFSVQCRGLNPVQSLEFANNCELVFIPYVTTTSSGSYVFQITRNGVDQGTSISKSGPFKAYESVVLTSWSGSYNALYSFKVIQEYNQQCAGMFVLRARHL